MRARRSSASFSAGRWEPRFNGAAHLRARRFVGDRLVRTRDPGLQRGRALARAEITPHTPERGPPSRASTGPRTCARGDAIDRVRVVAQETASTGPRTCARGDVAALRSGDLQRSASTGPRTCARGDWEVKESTQSGKHASTGPRTCARGDSSRFTRRALIRLLQRGRALARAEIS